MDIKAIVLFVSAAMAGCGGGSGQTPSSPYASKCMLACKAAGPCTDSKMISDCASNCVTTTQGLPALCAQCLIEHGSWFYDVCTCDNTGCDLCNTAGSTLCTMQQCDPMADTKCHDFELPSTTGSDCGKSCM